MQLVFVCDPPNLTSLSFPKIDTISVVSREYYNLLVARAQMVGRLVDYYLSGELNKHLNLKIEIYNLQRKKSLKIIKWYICCHHIHQHYK